MKITLKKTSTARSQSMASGRRCYFPANYDIYVDGEKMGEMIGFTQTRLRDGGHGHKANIKGQRLTWAGTRGDERTRMEAEIRAILANQ